MSSNNWISAWCSIIGSSHILEALPCQDNSRVEYVYDTNFIIAIVSDGAGSCERSHIGSKFLVDNAVEKLASLIKLQEWGRENGTDINEKIWREKAFDIFKELKTALKEKSEELNVEFKSLSATLMVAISDGSFIACSNIGDGRAAFRTIDAEWSQMIVPTKGEEANQTLFITSDLWDDGTNPEFFGSFFLHAPIAAFALLSDGCEKASFEILMYNEEEDRYYDPNKPFKPFFEPNYQNLIKLKEANAGQDRINDLWSNFIEKGNEKLISETDDKSMVLSAFIRNEAQV